MCTKGDRIEGKMLVHKYLDLLKVLLKSDTEKDGERLEISEDEDENSKLEEKCLYIQGLSKLTVDDLRLEPDILKQKHAEMEDKLGRFSLENGQDLLDVLRIMGPTETELALLKEKLERLYSDARRLRHTVENLVPKSDMMVAAEKISALARERDAKSKRNLRTIFINRAIIKNDLEETISFYSKLKKLEGADLACNKSKVMTSNEMADKVTEQVFFQIAHSESLQECRAMIYALRSMGIFEPRQVTLGFIRRKYSCLVARIGCIRYLPIKNHLKGFIGIIRTWFHDVVSQYANIFLYDEKIDNESRMHFFCMLSCCAVDILKRFKGLTERYLSETDDLDEIMSMYRYTKYYVNDTFSFGINMWSSLEGQFEKAIYQHARLIAEEATNRLRSWLLGLTRGDEGEAIKGNIDKLMEGLCDPLTIINEPELSPALAILLNALFKTCHALRLFDGTRCAQHLTDIWESTVHDWVSLLRDRLALIERELTEEHMLKKEYFEKTLINNFAQVFNETLYTFSGEYPARPINAGKIIDPLTVRT